MMTYIGHQQKPLMICTIRFLQENIEKYLGIKSSELMLQQQH